MFSEIINTISVLACVSLFFLFAFDFKKVEELEEERIYPVINYVNELDSDSDSNYNTSCSGSSSSSDIGFGFEFEPFILKRSSSLPIELKNDFKFKHKRSMSF